jgi:hypothetical protein
MREPGLRAMTAQGTLIGEASDYSVRACDHHPIIGAVTDDTIVGRLGAFFEAGHHEAAVCLFGSEAPATRPIRVTWTSRSSMSPRETTMIGETVATHTGLHTEASGLFDAFQASRRTDDN